MAGKSDALRERYERFSQGDLEGALDLWSDDFVWEGSSASDLPGSGRHEGKQAAIEVLQQAVGAWDKFELSADEFIEQGRHRRFTRTHRPGEGRAVRAAGRRAHLALSRRRPNLPPADPHRHPPKRTNSRYRLKLSGKARKRTPASRSSSNVGRLAPAALHTDLDKN